MSLTKERIAILQKRILLVLNKQDNWNVKMIKFLNNGVVNADLFWKRRVEES